MVKTYNDLYKAMKIFKDFNISDVKLVDLNVNGKMKLSGYFYNGVSFDFVVWKGGDKIWIELMN